jgi:hypothetical protein
MDSLFINLAGKYRAKIQINSAPKLMNINQSIVQSIGTTDTK